MQIEIITTKKKLTKSLVKQMQTANQLQIKNAIDPRGTGNLLGYVTDCHKQVLKMAIIHHINDYYTIPIYAWKKSNGGKSVYVTVGFGSKRATRSINFKSEDETDEFMNMMDKLRFSMVGQHIYL